MRSDSRAVLVLHLRALSTVRRLVRRRQRNAAPAECDQRHRPSIDRPRQIFFQKEFALINPFSGHTHIKTLKSKSVYLPEVEGPAADMRAEQLCTAAKKSRR